MRASKAGAARRTEKACHKRWNAYVKPQGKGALLVLHRIGLSPTTSCQSPGAQRFELLTHRFAVLVCHKPLKVIKTEIHRVYSNVSCYAVQLRDWLTTYYPGGAHAAPRRKSGVDAPAALT